MDQKSNACPLCPRCKSNKNVISIALEVPAQPGDKDLTDRVSRAQAFLKSMGHVIGVGQYYCRSCRFEW